MDVVPSIGGAVIRLDAQDLKRLRQGLNRLGLHVVEMSPIIRELRIALAELGEAVPPTPEQQATMRLDPAFADDEESFPIRPALREKEY